jgi:hypothetical protein
MRMIHVLRKPLSEGTVASNVLKHGCGGLNIDASRIGTSDYFGGGSKMSSSGHTLSEFESYEKGSGWVAGSVSGRWPANVILQHLDGCKCDGVKKVKGIGGGSSKKAPNEVYGKWDHFHPSNHTDKDGKETVANWACEPGCPVARLDEQSGERKTTWVSPTHKNNRDGDFMGTLNHPGHQGYNDTGGASRFYKQVGGKKDA